MLLGILKKRMKSSFIGIYKGKWKYENLGRGAPIPNFIFRFTCPKTRILFGFSPFAEFLLRPFYA
ncbi:MAG: hypothetical protein KHZ67_14260, partial [Clostridiales bacterium]|nr:hypothetical protein [Clostridiales bacterium]